MAQPKPFDHSSHSHERAPVLTPVEARQGVVSGRVLTILTASLMLAGVAFVVFYAVGVF